MSKPRIKPDPTGFFTWECVGEDSPTTGAFGSGFTPAEAYLDYVRTRDAYTIEALERQHMGDPDLKTGIYAPEVRALSMLEQAEAELGEDHAVVLPVRQAIHLLRATMGVTPH